MQHVCNCQSYFLTLQKELHVNFVWEAGMFGKPHTNNGTTSDIPSCHSQAMLVGRPHHDNRNVHHTLDRC